MFGSLDGSESPDWREQEAQAALALQLKDKAERERQARTWGDTARDVMNAPYRIAKGLVMPGTEDVVPQQPSGPAFGPLNPMDEVASMPRSNPVSRLGAGLGEAVVSGATAPGEALAGKLPAFDAEGHTSPEMIRRGFDLAALAGGASVAGTAEKLPALAADSGRAAAPIAVAARTSEAHIPALQEAYVAEMGPEAGQAAYNAYLVAHGEPPNVAKTAAAGEAGPAAGGPGGDVAAGAGGGAGGLQEAQRAAAGRAGAHQPLEGLPTKAMLINGEHFVPGPIGTVRDVAAQYMKDRPMPSYHMAPTKYHQLDEEHSRNVARAFDEMPHTPEDPATRASYDAMIKETGDQYKAIKATGLKIEPILPGMPDPYAANPRLAAKDVADNNHLWFFPTEGGFGSSAGSGIDMATHPMMQKTAETLGGKPLLANDLFRIVHDYFGHLKEGYGFRAAGEDNAWRSHASMYSDLARPAMTTETRGQNSWVNYGPHGDKNRTASAADTIYADQKVGLMPEWTMRDRGSPEPMISYHGSPYSFDQFSMDKIGTGEGNQVYGHGLYLADNHPVSEWYRHQLAPRRDPLLQQHGLDPEQGSDIGSALARANGDVKPVIEELRSQLKSLKEQQAGGDTSKATTNMIEVRQNKIDYLNDPERSTGQLYKVAIDAPKENFLDWDKPFSEQSPHVQERVRPALEASIEKQREAIKPMLETGMRGSGSFRRPVKPEERAKFEEVMKPDYINTFSGADIQRHVGLPAKDEHEAFINSSARLREAGVPGIRYLDQQSRGLAQHLDSMGQGKTHNYVAFNAPRILERTGSQPLTKDIPAPAVQVPPLKRGFNQGKENPPDMTQTVADPHRNMFPGVYGNPREIAEQAAVRVIPEDPAMKRLWGVTRSDLDEMSKGRVGNEEPNLNTVKNPSGARSAQNIQTPKNTQRLQDILAEAGKKAGLKHADAWYNLDPVFKRMVELFGPEEAPARFKKFNTMMGMASPGSDVTTEIARGTLAHAKATQGKFSEFEKFAGVPEGERSRTAGFPADMMYVPGHPYHRTSQAGPMAKYLEAGEIQSEKPKVPLYVHASGVKETGFQTKGPVGDAHFSRGVGLSDTRKGPSNVEGSFSRAEYQTLQPWWQHDVAGKLGIESVPAQARLWTTLGPQTGVSSPLGQGKLELLSRQIVNAAKRLRITPERARDLILSGKIGAGALGAVAAGPAVFGSLDGREE